MKDDEKRFFRTCYAFCRKMHPHTIEFGKYPRNIIAILEEAGYIHRKRAWYLLEKWSELGFYTYNITPDLGWFLPDKLPERYRVLLEPEVAPLNTRYFSVDKILLD